MGSTPHAVQSRRVGSGKKTRPARYKGADSQDDDDSARAKQRLLKKAAGLKKKKLKDIKTKRNLEKKYPHLKRGKDRKGPKTVKLPQPKDRQKLKKNKKKRKYPLLSDEDLELIEETKRRRKSRKSNRDKNFDRHNRLGKKRSPRNQPKRASASRKRNKPKKKKRKKKSRGRGRGRRRLR